jgi:hypothetical protein
MTLTPTPIPAEEDRLRHGVARDDQVPLCPGRKPSFWAVKRPTRPSRIPVHKWIPYGKRGRRSAAPGRPGPGKT